MNPKNKSKFDFVFFSLVTLRKHKIIKGDDPNLVLIGKFNKERQQA